jgi:hypothetical protein
VVGGAVAAHLPALGATDAPALALHVGDMFTIAGEYVINPITGLVARGVTRDGEPYGPFLQQFVITADVSSDEDAEIQFWPRLTGESPQKRRAAPARDDITPFMWKE